MRQMRFFLSVLAAAFMVHAVHAGPVLLNQVTSPGTNFAKDFSADRVILHHPGATIQVGDEIVGVANFSRFNSQNLPFGGLPAGYQLNVFFDLKIASFVPAAGTSPAYAVFTSSGNLANGAFAQLFEFTGAPGQNPLTFGAAPATSIANVQSENHILDLFLNPGNSDFWILEGVTPGQTVASINAILNGAPGNAAFPFFFGATAENNSGLIFAPNATGTTAGGLFGLSEHDFTGNGTLLAHQTGTNPNWNFNDSATFQFTLVPEPSSVVLMGIGSVVLGLAIVLVRRKFFLVPS